LGTNVCRVAERSNAVFTGTAVDVRDESKEYVSAVLKGRTVTLRHIVARFRIHKVFKGLPADQKTVEVRTGFDGGSCGVRFKVGETYLVYAGPFEYGGLTTNICSRTRPLNEATDDIPLIESSLAGKKLTAILGTVDRLGQRPCGGA
jgi:hypothetical protein